MHLGRVGALAAAAAPQRRYASASAAPKTGLRSKGPEKGAPIPKQFLSNDPHIVLGLKRGASKKEAKSQYYSLAMRYHPDNADSGDNEIMERINLAYQKLENGVEAQVEFEEIRTAGMSAEEKNARRTKSYTYGSADEEKAKWRAREKARQEAKERLLRRKKSYHASFDKRRMGEERLKYYNEHASADNCYERADGRWVYLIRGETWIGDRYIQAFFLNYRLGRANYAIEEFQKLGLEKLGGRGHIWGQMLDDKADRAYVERSIPLLYTDGEEREQTSVTKTTVATRTRELWRHTKTFEYLIVASIVGWLTYSWIGHVLLARRRGGMQYVYDEEAYALSKVRAAREREATTADMEQMSARLEEGERHLEALRRQREAAAVAVSAHDAHDIPTPAAADADATPSAPPPAPEAATPAAQ